MYEFINIREKILKSPTFKNEYYNLYFFIKINNTVLKNYNAY